MKCPTCGTENKSTNKACYRCGTTLKTEDVAPRGSSNSMWYTPDGPRNTTQPPTFWEDAGKRPAKYESGKDFVVLGDEETDVHIAADLKRRGAPVPDNRSKLRPLRDGQEIDVVVPPRAKRARVTRSRYRVNWQRFALMAVVIVALSAGLAYGLFTGYKWGVGTVSQWFADRNGTTPAQAPTVEKVRIDGTDWHKITFYGKPGEQILVTNPRRPLTIKNDGKEELLLDDQSFINSDLAAGQDKVTVQLEAVQIALDGKETPIKVEPYIIEVPLSPLKIILPKDQTTPTQEDLVLVKVKVTPGSRVIIDGINRTDIVDKQGYVSTYVNLDAKGVNDIIISVETKTYRKNDYSLKITRPKMDVPITLDSSTSTSTPENTIEIKGTTSPGATITTDATLAGKSSITMDPVSGNFSFTATLKRWGMNRINITATAANGVASTMTHCVTHKATLENYTKKAQVMDYTLVSTSAENIIGRVYLFEGSVQSKLEEEDSDYYLFNIGDASNPKLLVLEYTKDAGLKIDGYYKVYGDVLGTVESYPALTGQFVYEQTPPAGYNSGGSSAPAASPTPTAQNSSPAATNTASAGN